jgi:hypothetical protein
MEKQGLSGLPEQLSDGQAQVTPDSEWIPELDRISASSISCFPIILPEFYF